MGWIDIFGILVIVVGDFVSYYIGYREGWRDGVKYATKRATEEAVCNEEIFSEIVRVRERIRIAKALKQNKENEQ